MATGPQITLILKLRREIAALDPKMYADDTRTDAELRCAWRPLRAARPPRPPASRPRPLPPPPPPPPPRGSRACRRTSPGGPLGHFPPRGSQHPRAPPLARAGPWLWTGRASCASSARPGDCVGRLLARTCASSCRVFPRGMVQARRRPCERRSAPATPRARTARWWASTRFWSEETPPPAPAWQKTSTATRRPSRPWLGGRPRRPCAPVPRPCSGL